MSCLTASMAASWSGVSSIGEGRLELGHPVAVLGRVGEAGLAGPLGLDVDQLLGQVDDRLGHALLPLLPGRGADLGEGRLAPCRRRRTSAPGRSWRSARRAWSPRRTRGAASPRRARPTWSTNWSPRYRAIPWLTWTTRSPSLRSRKLSIARLSYRRRVTGRRTSARAKSSWSPMTSVRASIRWKPDRIRPTVRCSRPDWASSVSEKTSPSRSTSAALWQAIRTRSPAAAPSSSALTLVRSPENRSTLSIRRWQVASSESAARVETAIVGKPDQPLEASLRP